jgi:Zn-dependent protease with chaperone function
MTLVGVSATTVTAYAITRIEEVPVTKRMRVVLVTQELEDTVGKIYSQSDATSAIDKRDARAQFVGKIAAPIVAAADIVAGQSPRPWTIHVIESDDCNAFCAPGRVVVVHTGIIDHLQEIASGEIVHRLSQAQQEEYAKLGKCAVSAKDFLAAVLAHECGHAVGRHSAEKLSWLPFFAFVALLRHSSPIIGNMVDLGLRLPLSRMMESEADAIGMSIMAQSCTNMAAAGELQRRFAVTQNQTGSWTSTHPPGLDRASHCDELAAHLSTQHDTRCESLKQTCLRDQINSWLRWE